MISGAGVRLSPKWWLVWCVGFLWWVGPAVATERLVILHSSEHHGVALPLNPADDPRVGGLARRATLIEEIRNEGHPVLVVDSGDILVGTAFSSWFKGEPDVQVMNVMGYGGMVAGNHDFDFGVAHLSQLDELAQFPLLCTNLQSQGRPLPCQPSAVVQVGGWRIGLLGIVGRSNFPDTFNRETVKSLSLRDPLVAIHQEIAALRQRHPIDAIILLTHQDTEEDLMLLEQATGVDVIIGGHTEGFDGLYVFGSHTPVLSHRFPARVFVKTHRQGRSLGRLDLHAEFRSWSLARAENMPVTESIPVHPHVESILDVYRQRFSHEAFQVVGEAGVRLNGERPAIRTGETNLGNLLADLLRDTLQTDVALVNGGQIRQSLEAGAVTLGDVLSVLPFDSSLMTLQVSGKVLLHVLEHSVSQWPNHSGRFLQLSGLRVTYDMGQPIGHRVREVVIQGSQLKPDRMYSVGTDAFLAEGGDGFSMLSQVHARTDHQTPLRDVFLRTLQRTRLQAVLDGRIRIVPAPSS